LKHLKNKLKSYYNSHAKHPYFNAVMIGVFCRFIEFVAVKGCNSEWLQLLLRCHDIHHNDTQHNDTQHEDTQHKDTQHKDTQHNEIQHDTRYRVLLFCVTLC
jgi:hypothetical protein